MRFVAVGRNCYLCTMNDIIHLLPDSVANQIAAGEVIQRPASVVKELVENSVDAGATSIEVIIRDAGRTLIQVVDDGRGMTETDARMAFERHATSKILRADDLFALSTMGFRGEALASICAVAQVELRTKPQGADVGTRLVINGSKVESQEPVACGEGSNMMVKNLFFNLPARRKFLKKDAVEFSNIAREFERMALVNPSLDLSLLHNDVVVHKLMRGSLKQRIADLFGASVGRQLIPVETSTSIVTISGFVGMPEHARQRNQLQFLTVNGRHMRHPYFHKAVMHCYERLIAPDRQPNYFLNFKVDPATIDVNIHPTKNEIKFENESAVWQILVAAVREALGRFNAVPGIDFGRSLDSDIPEIPVFNPDASGDHSVEIDTSYNPFSTSGTSTSVAAPPRRQSVPADWNKLYEGFLNDTEPPTSVSSITTPSSIFGADNADETAVSPDSIQIREKYIVAPAMSGLMIIDQHRAHLKVLYEKIKARLVEAEVVSQHLLFPEMLQLEPRQSELLAQLEPQLHDLGFELSFLGSDTWSVIALPIELTDVSPVDTIRSIVDAVGEGLAAPSRDALVHSVALAMARGGAVKAGRKLSLPERESLISQLLALATPNYTPDGLPVIRLLSQPDIESLF